jgi:dienelactone hydrolase
MKKTLWLLPLLLLAGSCTWGGELDETCDWSIEPLLTTPEEALGLDSASPFPSDMYTVAANTPTGLRNNVHGQGMLFQELVNLADGWAPHGAIRVEFSGVISTATLPRTVTASTLPEASIQLIRMDTSLERVPFQLKPGVNNDSLVYLFPFEPLLERQRYAIVIRNTIQPAVAQCMARNQRFAAMLEGKTPRGVPAHVANATREIFKTLSSNVNRTGVPVSTIVLAVPYTTQSITGELLQKRDEVLQRKIEPFDVKVYPAFETDGAYEGQFNRDLVENVFPRLPQDLELGVDIDLSNVAYIVIGQYDSANYQAPSNWVRQLQGTEALTFLMSLPRIDRVRAEYREALGDPVRFPTVVFGHGMTACKETLLGVAHRFAEFGFAVIGIDVVEHGTRISDPNDNCGHSIAEGLRVMRLANPSIGRDNFRQTVLDQIQLVHMLASNPDLDYLSQSTSPVTNSTGLLKVDEFGFIGQSLGGIMGTMLTISEPRVTASVLNVPGGGLGDYAVLITETAYQPIDLEMPDRFLYESMAAAQIVLGPADPLYYAPYAGRFAPLGMADYRPSNVLVQQGMDDEVMPAYLTENFARGLGAVHVSPIEQAVAGMEAVNPPFRGGGAVTIALTQWSFPNYNTVPGKTKNWNSHYSLILSNVPATTDMIQEQAARFLWTGLFEGTAEVVDGLVP